MRPKVSADLKRNRLQITLSGSLSRKCLEGVYTEIRFCVADLQPGFSVISDYTQCKIGHLAGIGVFTKIRKYLTANQVGTVIRIVDKKQLVFVQLSRLTATFGGYQVAYVQTTEQAEALLAEAGQDIQAMGS